MSAAGLTVGSFKELSGHGYYLGADIIDIFDLRRPTGAISTKDVPSPSPVPETSSMALLGTVCALCWLATRLFGCETLNRSLVSALAPDL